MMFNNFSLFCMIALVAFTHGMPTDENANNMESFVPSNDLDQDNSHIVAQRNMKNIVDGTQQHIKLSGMTYTQQVRDGKCSVEFEGRTLSENSIIQIRKKLYRVEQCTLERAFHACGPNLLLMLNVVCRVVDQYTSTKVSGSQISTKLASTLTRRALANINTTPRVITESCCHNICTISELTRYCHH